MTAAVYAQYVSDNGTTYQRKTLTDIASALGLTTEALGAHQRVPRSIKERYILGKDPATGREHRLRGIGAANTMFTGAVTTIDVPNPNNRTGTALTLDIAGRVAEKRYAR